MKQPKEYFKRKRQESRVQVSDFSGKAFRFLRIAESVFDLCFPDVNPFKVHCFWNNTGKDKEAFKFDAHFYLHNHSDSEFVVEILVNGPRASMAEVRWSDISGGTYNDTLEYSEIAGETMIMFGSGLCSGSDLV